MYCKVNIGYGGVEVSDKGVNIITEPQPLSTNDGICFEPETDKVKQMLNLSHMYKFLDTICFEQVYVEPLQVGMRGFLYDVSFMINHEYYLHVLMDMGDNIYPVLIRNDKGEINPIKFTYEGEVMEKFFDEVKLDINNLFADN